MTDDFARNLRRVLDGLTFPAARWAIITQADWYGADAATCEVLRHLPVRRDAYRSLQDILDALRDLPMARPAPVTTNGRIRR